MIPEIGHYALILALCVAVVQGILPIYGAAVGNSMLMAVAKPAARGQFLLVLLAFCCLGYAFADKDFSVLYVALHVEFTAPPSLSARGHLGRARGVAAPLDVHPEHLDGCRLVLLHPSAGGDACAYSRRDGISQRGISLVHVDSLQSVRAVDPSRN